MHAWDATAHAPASGLPRMPDAGTAGEASPVVAFLRRAHARHLANREGSVATYIPELGLVDPEAFGIVIATVDGAVYEVGDTRTPFTIQSMAKPLTYAAILDVHGVDAVRDRIGVEPTGDAFNAISLSPATGMPLNPMVNAGAITAIGMVPPGRAAGEPTRTEHLLASLGRFAGRPLAIDEAVYRSERDTGHRNRAIANLLRGTGALDDRRSGLHRRDRYGVQRRGTYHSVDTGKYSTAPWLAQVLATEIAG